jgi:hypothetical protein
MARLQIVAAYFVTDHSKTTTPSSLRAFFSKVTSWQFFALENP